MVAKNGGMTYFNLKKKKKLCYKRIEITCQVSANLKNVYLYLCINFLNTKKIALYHIMI